MLTGRQIREARKLLQWSRARLARCASMAENLVAAIESRDGAAWLTEDQEDGLRRTFGAAGIEFTDGAGAGVKMRKDETI